MSGSIELADVSKPLEAYLKRNAVPIEITKSDIELCLMNQVVVKVIYVPNPIFPWSCFGVPKVLDHQLNTQTDLRGEAERLGAELAVLRLYKSISFDTASEHAPDDADSFSTTETIMKRFHGHPRATDRIKSAFEAAATAAHKERHSQAVETRLSQHGAPNDGVNYRGTPTKRFLSDQGIEAAAIHDMAMQIHFSLGEDVPAAPQLP